MPMSSSPNAWMPLSSDTFAGGASRIWGLIFPLFFVLATCSAGPKPKPDESPSADRPITPSDDQKKLKFDRAKKALEAGGYAEAKETFRLIQADKGSGKVAQLAELYVARAELGDLESSDGASSGWDRGLRMLKSL
ncbi:MAG: hypothetical protein ABEN55_13270, partial [Bradymonadaceae bacterium]